MDTQLSISGKKVVNRDMVIIKYDGPSFENRMELHSFTKQITSVEKILKQTIDVLNKTQKVKDTPKESKYFLELRRGSFETVLVILFANPILINVVSDCIFEYLKFLATGIKSKEYKNEIQDLVEDKSIRKSTRDIINPCMNGADRITIINGDVNNTLIINNDGRDKIEENLQKIENELPIEEYEQELIGYILKVDAVKAQEHLSKSKLGFVIEGQTQSIDTSFEKEMSEEELKKILFSRIKIKVIASYKGEDIIKLYIKSYDFAYIKKLDSYST